MRKLLIFVGFLIAILTVVPVALIATGTISASSLKMVLNVMTGAAGPAASEQTVRQRYHVPEGFLVQLYAQDIPRARFLHVTEMDDLLVSRPHAGDILLLRRDKNGDGRPDAEETLLENLSRPLGLDVHDGWLYIAQSNRVSRIAFDTNNGTTSGTLETLVDGLTDDGNHWSKTLRIGPDEKLYLAQGSTCNICEEADERRATMMRFELDGSEGQIVATGLRNSVGFDWSPFSGELFATDNGRDLLGDDYPPCELNKLEVDGFYGWPYFNGDNKADPDMGADPLAAQRKPTAPAFSFSAHNAPLGMTFLDATALPSEYQRSALVALHGSWNRSKPDGYKVVSLHWTDDGIEQRDFLSGFLVEDDISGRPVDVAQGPNGDIYISDDFAGAIYRVTYGKPTPGTSNALAQRSATRLDKTPPAWLAESDLLALTKSGETLYRQHNCASCHEQGENPARLDNLAQRLGYSAVMDALQAPQSPMPIYPLDELEQRALAAYLLSR